MEIIATELNAVLWGKRLVNPSKRKRDDQPAPLPVLGIGSISADVSRFPFLVKGLASTRKALNKLKGPVAIS